MNRKQYGLILVLSVVAGVIGSIASTRFLSGPPITRANSGFTKSRDFWISAFAGMTTIRYA